jgi:uncharacterized protein YcaQ
MGEGESQACTIGARRALGPVETVEDVGYLGFQDPAATVRFADNDLPILEGERFVGRIDPKFDRTTGTLLVRNIWWEPGIRPTRNRKRALEEGTERLAVLIGAGRTEINSRV